MASYYHLFNPVNLKDKYDPDQWRRSGIERFSGVMMFSTGIFLALIRLHEPYFKFILKKFSLGCFGIVLDVESDGVKSKTLSTFLASSLNIELVHIILKGIKKFSDVRLEATKPEVVSSSRESENFLKKME